MTTNKHIQRDGKETTKIFDNRNLEVDYSTLSPIIEKGMIILDVGCGTGSITKDIANIVGDTGHVTGIDNTKKFIDSGKKTYRQVTNMKLNHIDLFDFNPDQKFDLIVSARMLQWLNNPIEALLKMKSMLKPKGQISILDYNHNAMEWNPAPPESMQKFYQTFLRWRSDAGMNNGIADDLPQMLAEIGLKSIETFNSNEHYDRSRSDFLSKVSIWAKVANSTQMVEEGYMDDDLRQKAVKEYTEWVEKDAISMTMKLNEVRGKP